MLRERVRAVQTYLHSWNKRVDLTGSLLSVLFHGYLLLVGGVGILALYAEIPGARIHAFAINGNSVIESPKIVSTIESVLAHPFAFFVGRDVPLWAPQDEVASLVYALDPHIHEVHVSGRFSRTLSVDIVEETPAMLWCGGVLPTGTTSLPGECWFANEKGTIYAAAPSYTNAPYVTYYTTPAPIFFDQYPRTHEYPLGYLVADETTMDRLRVLSGALSERGHKIVSIGVTPDADVIVRTEEGVDFLFSLSRNILLDMKRLESLYEALRLKHQETSFQHVDLRFDTKIFYK